VAQDRYQRLIDLQYAIAHEINQRLVGETVSLLSEGPSKKDRGSATARTRTNKIVHVAGDHGAGTFLEARLTRATPHYLVGEPV
jgi:tRNA-2-methylthio-N6-dimethylallyladenosine synthase